MQGSAIIIYHYPCVDGGFAAYAAYKSRLDQGLQTTFVAYNPRSPPAVSDLPQAETAYFLDCVGPSAQYMMECCDRFAKVVVLDHHETGLRIMAGVRSPKFNCTYMAKHSGCLLAQEHFKPRLSVAMRLMFLYVEDNDIWRHEMPETKVFTAGISARNIDFAWHVNPAQVAALLESLDFDQVLQEGALEVVRRKTLINAYLEQSFSITLADVRHIRGVEISPHDHGITSELGHELALESSVGIGAIFMDGRVSLRAVENVDSTRISEVYGGGHAGASGFGMTREKWEKSKAFNVWYRVGSWPRVARLR